jgi:hypothetical protein
VLEKLNLRRLNHSVRQPVTERDHYEKERTVHPELVAQRVVNAEANRGIDRENNARHDLGQAAR